MADTMSRPSTQGTGRITPLLTLAGRFVTTSSLLSLARIAGAVAGFVTQVVLARTLFASSLGVFYSVTSLALWSV